MPKRPPAAPNDFIPCDTGVLLQQIGLWNVLATSGGRVIHRETGVTLPVARGYSVDIDLNWLDLYTVQRIHTYRGSRRVKGVVRDVYSDQVGEVVYRAGCWMQPFG
jgi:hypothetical protein